MKYFYFALCCVMALVSSVATACFENYKWENTRLVDRIHSESKSGDQRINDYKDMVAADEQTIAFLQNKITKLNGDFTNLEAQYTAQIQSYNAKISDFEAAQIKREDSYASFVSMVPSPEIIGTGLEKTFIFPKVVGVHGDILATNATFGAQYGRRLVFRFKGGNPQTFDVEELHPMMLKYLDIDAESAKENQQQIDSAWTAKTKSDKSQAATAYQIWQIQQNTAAKLAIDKQQADAASQAAWAAQLQATADKEKVDALMQDALKPATQINVIQQSAQSQAIYGR